MKIEKRERSNSAILLSVMLLCALTAAAQSKGDKCRPGGVIPLAGEPPAKIVVDPPLAGPLASRGVAIIQYCAENVHLVPVFGPGALTVSPRVGHLHVRVDDAAWVWADASGSPVILMGLPAGPHKVNIELKDANHQALDKGTVTFVVPEKSAPQQPKTNGPNCSGTISGAAGREVVQVRVDFDPSYVFPRHTHPGEEIVYVIEGTLEYHLEGKPSAIYKAGDVLFIPAGVGHWVKNVGRGNGAELATYVVEKGKPLITLVK